MGSALRRVAHPEEAGRTELLFEISLNGTYINGIAIRAPKVRDDRVAIMIAKQGSEQLAKIYQAEVDKLGEKEQGVFLFTGCRRWVAVEVVQPTINRLSIELLLPEPAIEEFELAKEIGVELAHLRNTITRSVAIGEAA